MFSCSWLLAADNVPDRVIETRARRSSSKSGANSESIACSMVPIFRRHARDCPIGSPEFRVSSNWNYRVNAT
ncbi:MAG: hypothetical protein A2428_00510 [Bdellovibrionales bacterium RIFOXYC1_FULL_54_43]|nr:MAG: hypothetical protein A2428_00510 [Bdellovibrionales bacterium RIFOXYC1_FULL_54_43]